MLVRRTSLIALCLVAGASLAGCKKGVSYGTIQMQIEDTDGHNPVADVQHGTVTVEVRHEMQLVQCDAGPCTTTIDAGSYQLDLPLASFDGRTQLQVDLTGDGNEWVGAMPTFQPGLEGLDVTGAARILVGPPSSCHTLTLDGFVHTTQPLLGTARRDAAAVVRRNLVLIVGGSDADGAPDDSVDRFDELLIDRDALPTWDGSVNIGAAHGVAISEDVSLVVGDSSVWRFVHSDSGPPSPEQIDGLASAVGIGSAVVAMPSGAAIVGGHELDAIHWIDMDANLSQATQLLAARTSPAVASMSDGLLIAGGNAAGDPRAEWIDGTHMATDLHADALPDARGGFLLPWADGTAAIWIGFEVDGAPSQDVYVFRGCPSCTVELADVSWSTARSEVSGVITAANALWLVGGTDENGPSQVIDIVRWSGGAPTIEAGPMLESARAGASVFEHAAGIVTVAGGLGAGAMGTGRALRDDFEMCFPAALDAP